MKISKCDIRWMKDANSLTDDNVSLESKLLHTDIFLIDANTDLRARSLWANRDTTASRCEENHFTKGSLRLHSLAEHRGCLRTLPFVRSKCKKLSTNRRRFLLPRADFHLVVSLVYTRDQLLNTHVCARTPPQMCREAIKWIMILKGDIVR